MAEPGRTNKADLDLEAASRDELVQEIIRLRERSAAQMRILTHLLPDRSGTFFISGFGGDVDESGLPDELSICPALGAGWNVTYHKGEARLLEGS